MQPQAHHRRPLTLQLSNVQVSLPGEAISALAAILARHLPAPEQSDPSPFLTVAEAAVYLRASRQRVYDLLSSRRLPRHRDCARVLIRRADLEAYVGQPGVERGPRESSYGRRDR
jgi:excisionase family DNA binding protein